MRSFKTEGIIIKRLNYKDADRILTIFTKEHGKIAVKAAGVRKITSRRSSHIELFNHTGMTLYQSTTGFPVLTEAVVIDHFSPIKKNLETIGHAYHLCELVNGLCPEQQENYAVFALLKKTLAALAQRIEATSEELRKIIHTFEIELLSILGYWHKSEVVPATMDVSAFIEDIMERKLRSKAIFSKLS
ncbi:MAG: DNA repair protein RecO [Patescibacteria group bacterium]